jgi:uncharacterized phage infection (PIP) family protein YhgE
MIRHALSLAAVVLLAAFVGGQPPRALLPKERADQFKKNQALIQQLVDKTVESSRTPNDHLKRAETYHKVLHEFSEEIRKAKDAGDKHRVEELTSHLNILLDQGLSPTLKRARLQVEGGTGAEDYEKVKELIRAQFNALYANLGDGSPAQKSLDQAKSNLDDITGPKKK